MLLLLVIFLQVAPPKQPMPLKSLPRNIAQDQKALWRFPVQLSRLQHWKPASGFLVVSGALVELDGYDTPYFRRTASLTGFNRSFSSLNTGFGEGLFPAAFYLGALARGDSYGQKTAILSIEAFADAEVVSEVIKNISRRRRPIEIPPSGDFSGTWFRAGPGLLVNRGSFTSGHTAGAFAVATVFAERYRHHRWVPWAAYGLAGLVAFSRVSNQNHFPSDVFAGAVFGYSISHFVVLKRPIN